MVLELIVSNKIDKDDTLIIYLLENATRVMTLQ